MSNRITIDPVTRIEGHAKISIFLEDDGSVDHARFHVTEFRGFEAFCRGRPLWEMPSLTGRTCGICPVSHLLASAKAGDAILAVRVPPAAHALRRLMNLGQIIQSHALSFFHLSAPDLLLGFDSDPSSRNVFGLMEQDPELARRGIALRKFGQEVIAALGGQKIHPAWAIPGGVRGNLSDDAKAHLQQTLPEAQKTVLLALDLIGKIHDDHPEEVRSFGQFPSLFMGLVTPQGNWEHYDGALRVVDETGAVLEDGFDPANYKQIIGEATGDNSYLKSPYYRPRVDETQAITPESPGAYRVGPLARLNICKQMGVPLADAELACFRERAGGMALSSFFYHYARVIEMLAATEFIERLLDMPEMSATHLQADAGINALHGVGVSEAPRGTLFHDYTVDADGLITHVNMIIATGQNNLPMNRTVTQIAKQFVHGDDIQEGMLNRVEAGIRAFDPCLSCSTHAIGQMPMQVQVIASDGHVVRELQRH
ncbi:MAG: Ni/Fe hydrogenase subunit alpha [Deinococcota bacterium]